LVLENNADPDGRAIGPRRCDSFIIKFNKKKRVKKNFQVLIIYGEKEEFVKIVFNGVLDGRSQGDFTFDDCRWEPPGSVWSIIKRYIGTFETRS
jgi:hypothetical protein